MREFFVPDDLFESALWELALFAVLIFSIFRLVRKMFFFVDVPKKIRDRVLRVLPFIEIIAWLAFAYWFLHRFLSDYSYFSLAFVLVFMILVISLSWPVLRDFASGLILKSEGAFRVGDQISVLEVNGRVWRLGYRSLVLESDQGGIVRIPYSRIARQKTMRASPKKVLTRHPIMLTAKKKEPLNQLVERMRQAALNAPWSSIKRTPEVILKSETGEHFVFEVTVFVSDKNHLYRIEEYLRQSFGSV